MTSKFTSVEYAIEEAEFITKELKETALIVLDKHNCLYVVTRPQYETPEWNTTTVLEVFN